MAVEYSTLSDKAIIKLYSDGEIIIQPFDRRNLNPNSYDVTLGPYFYREQKTDLSIYNIYSEEHVKKVWGPLQEAESASTLNLDTIEPTDKVILLKPGETVLCHTNEFIGGKTTVTTMMKARSSLGRNFINVCSCAGLGDIGYYNRWTMEIKNNSQYHTIPLVCGRRIAQIVFFQTDGLFQPATSYNLTGKYQTENELHLLMKKWKPDSMLPKMYKDFEATKKLNS